MSDKTHFEVFVAMNEGGDYEVGLDQEDAADRLQGSHGGYQCRIVRLGGFMTAPTLVETPSIDISDNAGETMELETEAA